jgi:hypothetical protein
VKTCHKQTQDRVELKRNCVLAPLVFIGLMAQLA